MSAAEQSAEIDALRAERDNALGGYHEAAGAADRFRDVLSECLGHGDENPGDDVLVAELRDHFGKTGPEPTRWRDFCTSALATLDQIEASRERPEGCTCPPGGGLPLCAYVNDDDPADEHGWRRVRFGCIDPDPSSPSGVQP